MKLPAGIVKSFKDIQLNFEALLSGFNDLSFRFVQSKGQKVLASGNTTLTWSGATTSAPTVVNHLLGSTPTNIQATVDTIGSGQHAFAEVGAAGSTTFAIQGVAVAAFTGTLGVYWEATS